MKNSRSFHNLARELLPSTDQMLSPPGPKGFIRKYRKTAVATRPKNFAAENPNKISGVRPGGDKKPSEPAKTVKERPKNDAKSAEVSPIPNPVPDTGVHPNRSTTTAAAPLLTTPPVVAKEPLASTGIFSPLPTLPTSSTHTSSFSSSAGVPTTTTPMAAANNPPAGSAFHLSVVIITLVSIGSVFALVGVFIIIRSCSRPNKRTHLTPSLPILQEDDFPDKYSSDGSPIFGGKERFSAQREEAASGNMNQNGLWRWTQYTQPGLTVPASAAVSTKTSGDNAGYGANAGNGWLGGTGIQPTSQAKTAYAYSDEKEAYPFTGQGAANKYTQAPLQQVQSALTRAASRLSNASMSLYPGSPLNNVGLAIDNASPFTGDGQKVINKRLSKTGLRSSTYATHDKTRDTTCTRYSEDFAYDGADVTSPVLFQTAKHVKVPTITVASAAATTGGGGRARIKSTYFAPGSYPRASTAVPAPPSLNTQNSSDSQDWRPPMKKSESRRDRETHALTSALGLLSPQMIPSSPQPTLYPDDSLSVVGDFRPPDKGSARSLSQKNQTPRYQPMTPHQESTASLGSLMLVDYGATSKSIANLGREVADGASAPRTAYKLDIKRADDKPPRVPSPPTLPSLSQMGLQHANPEAYADYRSPTYSIYGLYEADRKSRVTSLGY